MLAMGGRYREYAAHVKTLNESCLCVCVCVCVCVLCAGITEEDDLCLCVSVSASVNEMNEVGFTCISEADLILWRVGTRQIAASVDGIEVTTTANSSGGFVSSLVFTPEFLSSMSNGSEFQVGCLVQRSLFDIVEQDTREVVLFCESLGGREGGAGCVCVCRVRSKLLRVSL